MDKRALDFEAVRPAIAELARARGLKVVALFGSQATGALHAKSDIDIAVLGNKAVSYDKRMTLIDDFSTLFRREDVEVVDAASASPTLAYVVVRDGVLLYEAQSGDFLRWKLRAIREWLDTAWLRALGTRKLLDWVTRYA